jgi:hypothetical protein
MNKTLQNIKILYYWTGMDNQVQGYIGSCHTCLTKKRNQHNLNPTLNLYDRCDKPFQRVSIDILGGLETTKAGHSYVGVCVDAYSRYVVAFPMRSKKSCEFSHLMYKNLICIYGAPQMVNSDRGGEFTGTVFKNLLKSHGCLQALNSGGHSQATGGVEATVKRLLSLMRTMLSKHESWDILLPTICQVINSTAVVGTTMAPYLLVFGRLPNQPLAFLTDAQQDEWSTRSEIVGAILHMHNYAKERVKEAFTKYEESMKAYVDKTRKDKELHVGDVVYLEKFGAAVTSKVTCDKYQGPFVVYEVQDLDRVLIKDLTTEKLYPHPLHHSRLKPAFNFDQQVVDRRNELIALKKYCIKEDD